MRSLTQTSAGQLSDGQRQLFCVARALVRRPKILVLDESTSDLDQVSANELLRVIDENFKATTVISIAHRCGSRFCCWALLRRLSSGFGVRRLLAVLACGAAPG